MLLLAVWAYLQTEITDVPTLSYTSTSEIPSLSYTLSLEKHRLQNSLYFLHIQVRTSSQTKGLEWGSTLYQFLYWFWENKKRLFCSLKKAEPPCIAHIKEGVPSRSKIWYYQTYCGINRISRCDRYVFWYGVFLCPYNRAFPAQGNYHPSCSSI